jgi:hypothetical protein
VHLLTRRLFPVPFEWARLGATIAVLAAATVAGELLLPTAGVAGFAGRALLLVALPPLLVAARVVTLAELTGLRAALRR